MRGPWELTVSPDSFVILVIAEGSGSIAWGDGQSQEVKAGECFLLPATLGSCTLDGELTVLRSLVP